ncbi:Uncharacterised protein [BD1-7 clade bacterium]|uniref:Gonadoliberin III n=1 Tax=BD1-7 clade bacterium TaxID=2029982 RepID=A0A5S9N2W7_9GAMM|nr:Uncharacterised protein [BD1-7 clade bacterium]
MSDKAILYVLAFLLIAIGGGATWYKSQVLHFPLTPGQQVPVWTIDATVKFDPASGPITVKLNLPQNDGKLIILDETESSDGYGFNQLEDSGNNFAQWTRRTATGPQSLTYRIRAVDNPEPQPSTEADVPSIPSVPSYTSIEQGIVTKLTREATAMSSSNLTFGIELIKLFNSPEYRADVELLTNTNSREAKAKTLLGMFAVTETPARLAMGIELADGKRRQPPVFFIQTFADGKWATLNPITAERGVPEGTMLWRRGGHSLLEVTGGRNSRVDFSVIQSPLSAKQVAMQTTDKQANSPALIDFSIYSLPSESQNAFKKILLIPFGALVVVFLRVIVGVRTSGTFMPILIAVAFVQTQLIPGIIMFISIVSVGLLIRFFLTRLNLLLVARISAVVIVVIAIMASFSIISAKLGLTQVMTITFFPMIILAWTIERMSVLWEEEGPKEVVIQGFGSLAMASVAFLVMTNSYIEHLTFNFPEVLYILLALMLLLGSYNGYRLTELRRFRPMVEEGDK